MSELKRFFVDKIEEQTILGGGEYQHAVNVLRVKEGEQILLLDNSNYEYVATISKIEKKQLTATVVEKRLNENEAKTNVKLICGYLKGDKTEFVVQKATELGVKEIVVFSSQFSSAYINDNKLERLNKVAMESAKQCKRSIYPTVIYKPNFIEALQTGKDYKNKLFACEFATKNSANYEQLNGDTAIVVGSEGGFSQAEFEESLRLGYETVSLGKRILRAETASLVMTAIVMHRLGELE